MSAAFVGALWPHATLQAQGLIAADQPLVTTTWDAAPLADVLAAFAVLSGKTIVLGAGLDGSVTAEITDQPWDVAQSAMLFALSDSYY